MPPTLSAASQDYAPFKTSELRQSSSVVPTSCRLQLPTPSALVKKNRNRHLLTLRIPLGVLVLGGMPTQDASHLRFPSVSTPTPKSSAHFALSSFLSSSISFAESLFSSTM